MSYKPPSSIADLQWMIFAAVAIGAIIVGAIVWGMSASGVDQAEAEREAARFATVLGYKDPRVSCAKIDSDGDGYVSCTIAQGDGTRLEAIECAKKLTINEGCRMQKPGSGRTR